MEKLATFPTLHRVGEVRRGGGGGGEKGGEVRTFGVVCGNACEVRLA